MKIALRYYAIFCCDSFCYLVICQTQIETASQTVKIDVGKVAQFECKVKNLQPSQTVSY